MKSPGDSELPAAKYGAKTLVLSLTLTYILNVTSERRRKCPLRNIARIRADTEKFIHAFISSRLDYCYPSLSGVSKKAIICFYVKHLVLKLMKELCCIKKGSFIIVKVYFSAMALMVKTQQHFTKLKILQNYTTF